MASSLDNISMALFCDFENVALGVREANHENFDIRPILERLLLKGNIAVKKAYCDWERYKSFKAIMHEANFELIEIPHVRQSGKNSADIRLVVDALDLCYTKSHVNTFVIISGDSDFSPLVSKLRENAKQVIGVGVKHSTSDLLVSNCDEFIFYDDLLKAGADQPNRHSHRTPPQREGASPDADAETQRADTSHSLKNIAIGITVETFDALLSERGDGGKIWASTLKQAIKRRKPDFNESYYGFRAFGSLLAEAQSRGLLAIGRDEKSGTYVYRSDEGATARPAEARIDSGTGVKDTAAKAQDIANPKAASRGRRSKNKSDGAPQPISTEAASLPPAPSDAGSADSPRDPNPAAKTSAPPAPIARKPARKRGKRATDRSESE